MEKIEPKIKFIHYVLDKLSFQEKPLQPIEIAIINYSNKILLIITQMNKIGNIVDHFNLFFQNIIIFKVFCGNDSAGELKDNFDINFDIQTLFGSRDYEGFHELISRGIIEILNNDEFILKEIKANRGIDVDPKKFINPFRGKNLVLSVSLEINKEKNEEYDKFLFKSIVFSIKKEIINFF